MFQALQKLKEKEEITQDKVDHHIEQHDQRIGFIKRDVYFNSILKREGGKDRLSLVQNFADFNKRDKPFEKLFEKFGYKKPEYVMERGQFSMKKFKNKVKRRKDQQSKDQAQPDPAGQDEEDVEVIQAIPERYKRYRNISNLVDKVDRETEHLRAQS